MARSRSWSRSPVPGYRGAAPKSPWRWPAPAPHRFGSCTFRPRATRPSAAAAPAFAFAGGSYPEGHRIACGALRCRRQHRHHANAAPEEAILQRDPQQPCRSGGDGRRPDPGRRTEFRQRRRRGAEKSKVSVLLVSNGEGRNEGRKEDLDRGLEFGGASRHLLPTWQTLLSVVLRPGLTLGDISIHFLEKRLRGDFDGYAGQARV